MPTSPYKIYYIRGANFNQVLEDYPIEIVSAETDLGFRFKTRPGLGTKWLQPRVYGQVDRTGTKITLTHRLLNQPFDRKFARDVVKHELIHALLIQNGVPPDYKLPYEIRWHETVADLFSFRVLAGSKALESMAAWRWKEGNIAREACQLMARSRWKWNARDKVIRKYCGMKWPDWARRFLYE